MRLARDVSRNGEAIAYASSVSRLENIPVNPRECNELIDARPRKANARHVARTMHGIGFSKTLVIEPLFPTWRIIVNAYRRARLAGVHVMGECKIAKAEIARELVQQICELLFSR